MKAGMCAAFSTLLLLTGLALMGYTVATLHSLPYVCTPVLLWLAFVMCPVSVAWQRDIRGMRPPLGRHRGL